IRDFHVTGVQTCALPILSKIKENGSIFSPGEKRAYSNTNYILLTFILEDIEKEDFGTILEKRILKPLHLKDTYYGGKNAKQYKRSEERRVGKERRARRSR